MYIYMYVCVYLAYSYRTACVIGREGRLAEAEPCDSPPDERGRECAHEDECPVQESRHLMAYKHS